ncbi:MAG: hypothetical protein FJ279_12720 [Planctomycetes bacterium]|nr:hypothetical protein [Planctomycetota bacterium]MBM4084472.1 hypothetical protein [Planctomycetota bacterium]
MAEEKSKMETELTMPTRRTLIKAGLVVLPYVAPAIVSFTATPVNARECSPGRGGNGGGRQHGGGGGSFRRDGRDDNGHGNDPGHHDPSNPGRGRGGHGVDPG